MPPRNSLDADATGYQRRPLGATGNCLTPTGFLASAFAECAEPIAAVDRMPVVRLMDGLVSILPACRAISRVNPRIRPHRALACTWRRERLAEPSTVARPVDAFSDEPVAQQCQGSKALFGRESRILRHDFQTGVEAPPTTQEISCGPRAPCPVDGCGLQRPGLGFPLDVSRPAPGWLEHNATH